MKTNPVEPCCPRFDPAPWQDKTITWDHKLFVRDRVRSFLHIPLNFGAVVKRNMKVLEAAGAVTDKAILLSDENSPWGADLYIEVTKDVPGARMAPLSGTFLTRVYEGPYSKVRSWCADMQAGVAATGKPLKRLLFYYTTCPRCAKAYGKNYVVLLGQVD